MIRRRESDERIAGVLERLAWLRGAGIWPNGRRYLWTDAFGLVLLVSLSRARGEERWLAQACTLVSDVEHVLGRERGLRIGEAPERDGQYYHYLAMWIFALERLGRLLPEYHARAVALAHAIHEPFVVPGRGLWWRMKEDLSGPYPGFGLGVLDAFQGFVVYRALVAPSLAPELAQLRALVEAHQERLVLTQDLSLGMMLWLTHFHPEEPWARLQRARALATLERMWIDPPGYFCRQPGQPAVKFAFTNHGVSIGLQAVGAMPERVARLREFFRTYRSGERLDDEAITHVMACCAELPGELLVESESG